VCFALWAVPILNPLLVDPKKPYWVEFTIDWRVLIGTTLLTLLVGIVSGLVPALRALRFDPQATLRDGGHGATAGQSGRLSRVLSVAQIALATTVLVAAAVLSRGAYQAGHEPYPGEASRLLVASSAINKAGTTLRPTLFTALLERGAVLPGVECAALTTRDPVDDGWRTPIEVMGRPETDTNDGMQFPAEWVSPAYFQVFGLRALRGGC